MKFRILSSLFLLVSLAAAQERAGLLVETYGQLLLIRSDGTQRMLADRINSAAISPDGQLLAISNTAQALLVTNLSSGAAREITRLPAGAHFEEIAWMPDSTAIAYEAIVPGQGDGLFLAMFPPVGGPPRNLGHWYQGFSISPDGTKIVHAVNGATPHDSGLEVLDVASGKRTLVHKTKNIVWDARYSPDGKFIAYQITTSNPPSSDDDEPDCTPPTIGLRLYSLADGSDTAVTIPAVPKDWDDLKNFAWSPDGKRIALALGTTDCDYPGSAVGVFVTTLDLKSQFRASKTDMSLEPAFAPDGSALAFVDLSESPARLMRYDLKTGQLTLIRRASEDANYFRLLDWK